MKGYRGFFLGMCSGLLLAALVLISTKYLGIHLLPDTSLADDVWEKTKVVEKYIDTYYWKDDVSDETMSDYAVKGIVTALGDKYSNYYTQEEYEAAMNSVEGAYDGIGMTVELDTETNRKMIKEVQTGTPAEKAGLKEGDEIRSINGTDVSEMDFKEALNLIRTGEGENTTLCIVRTENNEEKTMEITVASEKIVSQSVTSKMLDEEIGYIQISAFNNETTAQFETQMEALEKKNQKGMIVDVRDNGGGSLTAVIAMLDDLLPEGKLITEKSRTGDKVYESTDEKHFDKPLVVLINGNSASASEVFAGTLQDRGAASLVGVKSFGKGIVQTIFSLQDSCGGGIKLTTGEYFLPSGRSIHEKGLTPDVESEYTGSTGQIGESDDNQLQKAVEVLKTKL